MLQRSWLFVPADSERKLAKAVDCKADVLILDLEDSVTPERKAAARAMALEFLKSHPPATRKNKLYVRINPLESDTPLRDLDAVSPGFPNGIMQPKCGHPHEVGILSRHLDALEKRDGAVAGATKIVAIAGETARGVLALSAYPRMVKRLPRLAGLTWGPWDLAADLGAAVNTDTEGNLTSPYRTAMSLTLFAAKAAGVQAIDTVYTAFKDAAGFVKICRATRMEGWTGKLAIHPDQVSLIHEGFRPSTEEITKAERVVAALAGGEGAVSLDGVMLDRPHRLQAEYILALRTAT